MRAKLSIRAFLQRPRLYIFPTRFGFSLLAISLAILWGGINYGISLVSLLAFFLFSLFFVIKLFTYRNLHGLQFRVGDAEPVFCGESALFPVEIKNPAKRARYAVRLSRQPRHWWPWPKKEAEKALHVEIAADCSQQCVLPITTTHRGRFDLGSLYVRSVFPFGWLTVWYKLPARASVLIYPAPCGHLPLPLPGHDRATSSELGNANTEENDFYGMREYRAGDRMHAIAWKRLAAGQAPLVKIFRGGTPGALLLDWDLLQAINNREEKLSQLCRWVVDAAERNCVYGLRLPEKACVIGHGITHREEALKWLALSPS